MKTDVMIEFSHLDPQFEQNVFIQIFFYFFENKKVTETVEFC